MKEYSRYRQNLLFSGFNYRSVIWSQLYLPLLQSILFALRFKRVPLLVQASKQLRQTN